MIAAIHRRRSPWLGLFGRRIARDTALYVAITLAAVIALFIAVDSVEAVNRALSRATIRDMLELELFNTPQIAQQFASFAVLIGTTAAIGALVRRQEIVAIFSAGASPSVIFRPVLIFGVLMALADAAMTEWIVPPARAEVAAARRRLGLPPRDTELMNASRAWFRGADLVYRVNVMEDRRGRALAGVLILRLAEGKLSERWDVDRLVFEGDQWIGERILHRTFAGDTLETEELARGPIALAESPDDFVRSIGAPDHLSYAALMETTRARERLGQPAIAHRLELYRRHAYPASLIVAAVLAAAIALQIGRRPTIARSLAAGAFFGFVLWVLDEVGFALGSTAAVPPWIAAHLSLAAATALAAGAWATVVRPRLLG